MTVTDISQCGFRIVQTEKNPRHVIFPATLSFLCGESIDIEADLEWEEDGEAGYSFRSLIPSGLMDKELQFVTLHDA